MNSSYQYVAPCSRSNSFKGFVNVPKSETFVCYIKNTAATWSINRIIPVSIALNRISLGGGAVTADQPGGLRQVVVH